MATLKCLACGQDNKVGDESCSSCSSSLNLRLCSACEAINANDAERCHSCGAQFSAETQAAPVVEEAAAAQEAPPSDKALPAAWVVGAERAMRGSRRATTALWLVPALAVAGFAYYFFYGTPQAAPKPAPTPIMEIKAAPVEVKQAAVPVEPPKTPIEPKRAFVPVRQTRADGAPTAVIAAPVKPAVAPAKESAPSLLEQRPRVTHTKAEQRETPEPATVRAAVGASVPGTAAKLELAACAPGMSALGLCKSN